MSLTPAAGPILDKVTYTGFKPEAATEVIPLLARFYLKDYGTDIEFRQRLAHEVQEFLNELDNPSNGAICAWLDGKLVGAVFIDASKVETQGARIRWFIVDEKYRKLGLGKALFEKALDHCKARGFHRITIKTFKDMDPAVGLYSRYGFSLFEERNISTRKTPLVEQWFEKEA